VRYISICIQLRLLRKPSRLFRSIAYQTLPIHPLEHQKLQLLARLSISCEEMTSTSTEDNIAIGLIILTMSILVWVYLMVSQRADELKLRAHAVSSGSPPSDNSLYCGYSNSLYDDGLSSDKLQNFFLGSRHRTSSSVLPDVDIHAPISILSQSCAAAQCVICLENISPKSQVRIPRVCGHAMHAKCAELWLIDTARNCCPTCMAPVVPTRDSEMRFLGHTATLAS